MALYCDVNALQKFAEIAFLSKNGCYLAKALSFRKFHADSIEEKQASFQAVSLQERKEHPEIVQSSIAQYRSPSPTQLQQNDGEVAANDGESSVISSVISSVKFGNITINETQKKMLGLMEENKQISAAGMAEALNLSVRAIEKNIRELREVGILVRHGSARGGYWEVIR